MKIKSLLVFIFIGLIVSSCNKDPNDLLFLNLEGEFIISADQVLTNDGPKFSYRITTIQDQDCTTSEIIYKLIDEEGELNLTLEDITQVDNCSTDEGQVIQTIPINITEGSNAIAISLRNVVKNTGTINTTELQHIMQLDNPEGILVGNTIVNRIPEDAIFGQIYSSEVEAPIIQNLLDSLNSFNNGILIDGYYTSYFSVKDQKAEIHEDLSSIEIHKDVYYRIADKEAFKNYIRSYKDSHPSVRFQLRDAQTGELLFF